jgi:hypothetical protein
MSGINRTYSEPEAGLDKFAAELTEAAYRVALRHGVNGSWLDLELDLWHTLTDALRNKRHELSARHDLGSTPVRGLPHAAHATV